VGDGMSVGVSTFSGVGVGVRREVSERNGEFDCEGVGLYVAMGVFESVGVVGGDEGDAF